jgi:hypothetical protein
MGGFKSEAEHQGSMSQIVWAISGDKVTNHRARQLAVG